MNLNALKKSTKHYAEQEVKGDAFDPDLVKIPQDILDMIEHGGCSMAAETLAARQRITIPAARDLIRAWQAEQHSTNQHEG